MRRGKQAQNPGLLASRILKVRELFLREGRVSSPYLILLNISKFSGIKAPYRVTIPSIEVALVGNSDARLGYHNRLSGKKNHRVNGLCDYKISSILNLLGLL